MTNKIQLDLWRTLGWALVLVVGLSVAGFFIYSSNKVKADQQETYSATIIGGTFDVCPQVVEENGGVLYLLTKNGDSGIVTKKDYNGITIGEVLCDINDRLSRRVDTQSIAVGRAGGAREGDSALYIANSNGIEVRDNTVSPPTDNVMELRVLGLNLNPQYSDKGFYIRINRTSVGSGYVYEWLPKDPRAIAVSASYGANYVFVYDWNSEKIFRFNRMSGYSQNNQIPFNLDPTHANETKLIGIGSQRHSVWGLAVNSTGLYALASGTILRFQNFGGNDGNESPNTFTDEDRLSPPEDRNSASYVDLLAVDNYGNCYVAARSIDRATNLFYGAVYKKPAGSNTLFPIYRDDNAIFTSIAVSPDGSKVFVVDKTAKKLIKLTKTRVFTIMTTTTLPRLSFVGPTTSTTTTMPPLLGGQTYNLAPFGAISGLSPSTLSGPQGIAVDNANRLIYAADTGNKRIIKYDQNGNGTLFVGNTATNQRFRSPTDLAIDTSGNVYVLDKGYKKVFKFKMNGDFDGEKTITTDLYESINGLTINNAGALFVAKETNYGGSVLRYESFTAQDSTIVAFPGLSPASLKRVQDVAVSANGTVYAADNSASNDPYYQNCRIVANSGSRFSTFGSVSTQVRFPSSLTIDSSGKIYFLNSLPANSPQAQFIKFDPTGAGQLIASNSELNRPKGIAVDNTGDNVYIADTGNNRIVKLSR